MALAPVAATVLAGLFAARTAVLALRARSAALAVWSFALAQFAVASAALAWGVGVGWSQPIYRVFYLFGAVLNVAWLGLGTVWLLAPRTAALWATIALVGASIFAVWSVALADLALIPTYEVATGAIPAPADVVPPAARMLSRVFSIGGSVVVLGGLVWSITRRRERAGGLALLAAGIVVAGVAGELARAGRAGAFSAALAAGIALMFVGFLRSGP